ncbi:MAG: C25 family cysteine peptidase, partial [Promethearchaeota archaeon]
MVKLSTNKFFWIFISSIILFPFVNIILSYNDGVINENCNQIYLNEENNIPDLDEINSKIPKINYERIYEKWYDPKIEMLIITPDNQNFTEAVKPLADWKNEKGVKTLILSNFSKYSGTDNPEKIRNMIKTYYDKENIRWVLLAGDAEDALIPIRKVYNPDVIVVGGESEYSTWSDYYKPTDFYYADLSGTWDNDDDGKWGESSVYNANNKDEISWTPDVYVGRFPADDSNQLELMVNKTLKYEKNPFKGGWMNRMLLAGGISSYSPPEDEARLTEYIWKHYTIQEMRFTHLHRTTSSFTPDAPTSGNNQSSLDEPNFNNYFNQGYSTVIFAGHGIPTKYTDASGDVYSSTEAGLCSNDYMPS